MHLFFDLRGEIKYVFLGEVGSENSAAFYEPMKTFDKKGLLLDLSGSGDEI